MADTPLFKIADDSEEPPHRYILLQPAEPAQLAQDLAPRVRGVYFDAEAARARITAAAEELREFDGSDFTAEDIHEAVTDELDAVLPQAWGKQPDDLSEGSRDEDGPDGEEELDGGTGGSSSGLPSATAKDQESADPSPEAPAERQRRGRPQATDVQRSELGEIVAADVLRTLFETVVPASRLAEKEIPDQQTRGADVLGLEDVEADTIVLVLAEVKGSTDKRSPPGVLAGMAEKLKQLATERRVLLQELIWLRDHAEEAWAPLCARVCGAFLLGRRLFSILLVPVLVRTASTAGDDDRGEFKSDPDSFGERIRFVTVHIDEDLFELARTVYAIARGEGA